MEISPGQLLVTKTTMEATQIPLDYSKEAKVSIDKRKTLRNLRINRDQVLMVVEIPEDTTHYLPGWASAVTAKRIIFLLGDKLCISTSINNWNEYFDVVSFPNSDNMEKSQGKMSPRHSDEELQSDQG